MKNFKPNSLVIVIALIGLSIPVLKAQSTDSESAFKNWAAGVDAGLYGFGAYGATTLAPNLQVRAGFDFLTFSYNKGIDFNAEAINLNTDVAVVTDASLEGSITKAKLKFPNFKVLLDYYPVKDGIFSLTAGFYVGNNNVSADGLVENLSATIDGHYTSMSYSEFTSRFPQAETGFEFEDIVIKPGKDGSFDAKMKMGNIFKPYIGMGLGRAIPKSRVGFKFDLGIVYQGKYTVESDNIVQGIGKINDMAADFDLGFSKNLLNWWPILNFSLSYRIQ